MTSNPFVSSLSERSLQFSGRKDTDSPVVEAKCLVVQDKKKALHFAIVEKSGFDGLKKLSKDLGVKDLRFAAPEILQNAGETPQFCTPNILKSISVGTIHVDENFKDQKVQFALDETSSVTLSCDTLLKFVEGHGEIVFFKAGAAEAVPEPKAAKPKAKAKAAVAAADPDKALIGLTVSKMGNFPEWYTQVITKAEMIDYYDVSGCYILRPWAYEIWERVQQFIDGEFKKSGIRNCYFPTFVTKGRLEAEESHIEGFSAEVAWVTKSGQSDLAEPIAIRPTSETIMYPAFSRWIRSHRDLPVLVNQWCTVVRWEFKQPTPFIRTREFLWQEGHTAHATAEEAVQRAKDMLEVYRRAYEEILAVPVVPGMKSETEKFAGGHSTYTVEGFIEANGRGLQAATSHYLADNFAKIFDVNFEDQNREKRTAHQTSFGFTTRSIGAMIMVHGDDKGLVLPPRCAPVQAVIVPIVFKEGADISALRARCHSLADTLKLADIRVEVDDRDNYNPGWKYNHWDLKGVPLRLEIGPRELTSNTVRLVRRLDGRTCTINFAGETGEDTVSTETVSTIVQRELDDVQDKMLADARVRQEAGRVVISEWAQVMPALDAKKLILAPWCGDEDCEEWCKKETTRLSQEVQELTGMAGGMKTLCIPFTAPVPDQGTKCFRPGCKDAVCFALWGRSY